MFCSVYRPVGKLIRHAMQAGDNRARIPTTLLRYHIEVSFSSRKGKK
jgi:hypothetical protein